MNSLDKYRNKIDKIDSQILKLLIQRFDIIKNHISIEKKKLNLPILQKNRYQEIIKNLISQSDSLLDKKLIEDIWNTIHKYSLKTQK